MCSLHDQNQGLGQYLDIFKCHLVYMYNLIHNCSQVTKRNFLIKLKFSLEKNNPEQTDNTQKIIFAIANE